ncbi:MAG: hypothetical protein IT370_02810 [Deltaproteobacteria bacterium]|nr:hypothetical protein [Deltaproteobacteria bacterium]
MKRLGLVGFGLLFVCAGCGGDDDDTTTVDSGAVVDSSMMTADAAAPTAVSGHVTIDNGGSGAPLGTGTVSVAGASPAITTALANDGAYSLQVPRGPAFIRVTSPTVATIQEGVVVGATPITLDFRAIPNSDVTQVLGALSITQDTAKGVVLVDFAGGAPGSQYGATLSATHGASFNPETPALASTVPGDKQLVFPNVVAGTTTVTAMPPSGHTCSPHAAITAFRVDANVFTQVVFDCN